MRYYHFIKDKSCDIIILSKIHMIKWKWKFVKWKCVRATFILECVRYENVGDISMCMMLRYMQPREACRKHKKNKSLSDTNIKPYLQYRHLLQRDPLLRSQHRSLCAHINMHTHICLYVYTTFIWIAKDYVLRRYWVYKSWSWFRNGRIATNLSGLKWN